MGLKFSSFKTIEKIPKKNIKKFSKLLNNTSVCAGIWDDKAVVRFINEPYCKMLQLPSNKTVLNKTIDEIKLSDQSVYHPYQPFYQAQVLDLLNQVNTEVKINYTCELVFTYQLYKPTFHYLHVKANMKRIKIDHQVFTLIWCVPLKDRPKINPFLIKDKKKMKKKKKKQNTQDLYFQTYFSEDLECIQEIEEIEEIESSESSESSEDEDISEKSNHISMLQEVIN
ncbi:hypothetical protein M0813_16225 [Anaeramoeba flamelloides]|uniref:PAS domain-containing protein n=1 Tax=Anaeramoeba flamelloides TaxID=1746091 RepID=A0ABQ8Z024_9EUKA|nr:hypothetical protein M0813_16225 [Anaeramoeba flamelloides]